MTQNNTVDIADVVETQERSWFTITLFVLCALVMLADGFDNQALNYAAPRIIKEWGINRALMTPVFNISIIGWMAGSVVFAMLADRIGRRRAILMATALFGAFTFAVPFAHNLVELSILRFCAALGIGGGMPMAVSLITDYARSGKRALIITLLYLGYTAGSAGGGLLAAEIIPAYGWRSVFYVGGAGAVLVMLALFAGLPESIRYLALRKPNSERILGYARRLKPSAHFADGTRFTIQEQVRTGVPVGHLFTEGRSAMTIFLWLGLGLSFVTHFFLSQWMTTLLSDQIGYANAARSQALFQLGAGFSWFFGWMIDKKGLKVMTLTMILGAIPVAALGVAVGSGASLTMMMAMASGLLVLGGNIGLNAVSSMIYPTFIRSTATGASFAVARIGAIIGPLLAGLLIAVGTPIGTIFLLGALPLLASGIACFMLNRTITPEAAKEMSLRSALSRH
ncbi:MFS transporter [Paraburkholderia sp. ZP32-5]|uniref:MFS transporter n=1 Tax=Paraburkholderia sp. ZP32-5 TaxID=2883245 RepID=UPI001F31177F|nr:MFS transporter [Paraburkholderia sp. ZP32-5]